MTKTIIQLSATLLTVMAASSALAATYSCTNQDGNVMRINKTSTQARFKLKVDDGDFYHCQQVRTSRTSGGNVRGGFLQRTLPNGEIIICNQFRCYRENDDWRYNPRTSAGAI